MVSQAVRFSLIAFVALIATSCSSPPPPELAVSRAAILNAPCTSNANCTTPGEVCSAGFCKKDVNYPCTQNSDCATGDCSGGLCKIANGSDCTRNNQCESTRCNKVLACKDTVGTECSCPSNGSNCVGGGSIKCNNAPAGCNCVYCAGDQLACHGSCVAIDVNNCGACDVVCPTAANATRTCNVLTAVCGFTCNAGFQDRAGNPATGCEFNTGSSDPNNCGTAGTVCPDDNNDCTNKVCIAGVCGQAPKTNGATCNDGNACTQTDTCQAGVCAGTNPVTCAAPDQCHLAGVCNPATGTCSNPNKADGAPCSDHFPTLHAARAIEHEHHVAWLHAARE